MILQVIAIVVFIVALGLFVDYSNKKYLEHAVNLSTQLFQGSVDLQRYAGKWYEVASLPNSFQTDCKCSTANYTVQENGTIAVQNTCQSIQNNEKMVANAIAWSNNVQNTWIKVSFVLGNNIAAQYWPFSLASADYLILYVDAEYTRALVGSSDKQYLWVLSRTPTMEKGQYDEMLAIALKNGYQIEKVKMTCL